MKKKTIKKRKIYRECYDLDQAFLDWLRVRLPVYLKSARNIIDFKRSRYYLYNGKEYHQDELIEMMIKDLKIAEVYNLWDKEYQVAVNEILEIWKEVCGAMWW